MCSLMPFDKGLKAYNTAYNETLHIARVSALALPFGLSFDFRMGFPLLSLTLPQLSAFWTK